MQFVFQDQVNHFIGALANLVQGVKPIPQLKIQSQPELVEQPIQLPDMPIADMPIADLAVTDVPNADTPIIDLPILDEPIVSQSIEMLIRPWLPTIEGKIADCYLPSPPLMDFRPCDDNSIAGNGVQPIEQVRNFSSLVSNFAPETTNTIEDLAEVGRALLSERSLGEDDFSHAVDQIFEHSLSIWQNN